jgi:dolichol-phosphate mannosyltransferase
LRPEGKKVSVVLPTYCEKDNIVPLIHGLHENIAAPLEIIVVDDASPDGTADVVAALADPDVKLIRRKARGLAAAFNRGIIESTGDIICWMDADTCMPPEVLRQMVDKLDEYDIAIGSRYAEGGSDNRAWVRVTSSRMVNGFARWLLGGGIGDYDSGFIAIRREVFDHVTIMPYGYGEYFIEMICDAHRSGLKITEVGYAFKDRTEGFSKSMPSLFSFMRTGTHYFYRIVKVWSRLGGK